ncbi:hypothetical protein SCUCBS95973_009840 [Sporothrix curviconia]|uniref:Zn(2)-C6 fungal-type domain-containing protein n=1 Tax=Sporothrix curviconia TaxID=1260050 RepID=A0ABP0D022_9PEZI
MLSLIDEVTRRAGQSPASSSHGSAGTPGRTAQHGASGSVAAVPAPGRRAVKACTNCARIKCKCIPRAGSGLDPSAGYGCERCHRLGKTCEPSVAAVPAARRARAANTMTTATTSTLRTRASTSRSARLEAKLNDLVDLLRTTHAAAEAQAEPSTAASASASTVNKSMAPAGGDNALASDEDEDAEGDDDDEDEEDDGDDNDVNDSNDNNDVAATAEQELLPYEAEACLRRFTEEMLPLAPFILLSGPDCTVRRLQRDFPFLWRCIQAAAAVLPAHRIGAAAAARRAIVRRVVEQGERSLDVLLGLLTFVTWVHLSTKDRFHRNFATVASQLAVCVAWDLGLTMPPLLEPATQALRFVPVVQIPGIPASMWKMQRSMDERRAVLGVFLVTAVTSQMFRSADGLRWSPYLEQVLGEVEASLSLPGHEPQDRTLVRQVRLQLLINQVRYAATGGSGASYWTGGGGCGGSATGANGSMYRSFGSGPVQLPGPYMDSLRRQLDEICSVVDGTSSAFDNFTTHNLYHFAMLAIHESVLARKPASRHSQNGQNGQNHSAQNPSAAAAAAWLPDLQRFEIYQRCLASVHAWFDRLFAWPLSCYHCLPAGTFLQMFYVLVCLHKLTTLKDPAWNVDAVRGVMDLFPTIDRILGMCHELRAMLAQQQQASSSRPSPSSAGPSTGTGGTAGSGGYGTSVNTPATTATATTATTASASASGIGSGGVGSGSIIEEDEHDPILVAIRKFSTLKIIWQNEMVAQEREKQEAAAAHATGPLLVNGQPVGDVDLGSTDTPMLETDYYSLDVLNYFHAMPDMADLTWP